MGLGLEFVVCGGGESGVVGSGVEGAKGAEDSGVGGRVGLGVM